MGKSGFEVKSTSLLDGISVDEILTTDGLQSILTSISSVDEEKYSKEDYQSFLDKLKTVAENAMRKGDIYEGDLLFTALIQKLDFKEDEESQKRCFKIRLDFAEVLLFLTVTFTLKGNFIHAGQFLMQALDQLCLVPYSHRKDKSKMAPLFDAASGLILKYCQVNKKNRSKQIEFLKDYLLGLKNYKSFFKEYPPEYQMFKTHMIRKLMINLQQESEVYLEQEEYKKVQAFNLEALAYFNRIGVYKNQDRKLAANSKKLLAKAGLYLLMDEGLDLSQKKKSVSAAKFYIGILKHPDFTSDALSDNEKIHYLTLVHSALKKLLDQSLIKFDISKRNLPELYLCFVIFEGLNQVASLLPNLSLEYLITYSEMTFSALCRKVLTDAGKGEGLFLALERFSLLTFNLGKTSDNIYLMRSGFLFNQIRDNVLVLLAEMAKDPVCLGRYPQIEKLSKIWMLELGEGVDPANISHQGIALLESAEEKASQATMQDEHSVSAAGEIEAIKSENFYLNLRELIRVLKKQSNYLSQMLSTAVSQNSVIPQLLSLASQPFIPIPLSTPLVSDSSSSSSPDIPINEDTSASSSFSVDSPHQTYSLMRKLKRSTEEEIKDQENEDSSDKNHEKDQDNIYKKSRFEKKK